MIAINIALIDCDMNRKKRKIFPTLTLMKLSAFLKKNGHKTNLLTPDEYINNDLFTNYDKAFASCIFTENKSIAQKLAEMGVIVGGSGIDMTSRLPDEIEHVMPDYSLYGIYNTAYGFLSRGCPRQCPFCIVAKKEGAKSEKVADLTEWWNGQKNIKLLDPNILACEDCIDLLSQLVDSNAVIDITQGADARLLTEKNIELLMAMKIKTIHFAWDSPNDTVIPQKLNFFKRHTKNLPSDYVHHKCYVLTNYWSTTKQDLYRIYWLRDNGFDPYVMIFDKPNAPPVTKRIQRWCNNKFIFRSEPNFENYNKGASKNDNTCKL